MLTRKCLCDLRVFRTLCRLRLARGVRVCVCRRVYLNALKVRALRVFAACPIVDMSVIVHPTYYRDVARRSPHPRIDIHTIGTAPSRTRHAGTPCCCRGRRRLANFVVCRSYKVGAANKLLHCEKLTTRLRLSKNALVCDLIGRVQVGCPYPAAFSQVACSYETALLAQFLASHKLTRLFDAKFVFA